MSVTTYGWLVLAFPLGGAVLTGLTFKALPSRRPSWIAASYAALFLIA